MKTIVTEFIAGDPVYNQTGAEAKSQTNGVDKAGPFVFIEESKGNFEIMMKHEARGKGVKRLRAKGLFNA